MKIRYTFLLLLGLVSFACQELEFNNPLDPAVPLKPPTNLTLSSMTETQVTLQWKNNNTPPANSTELATRIEQSTNNSGYSKVAVVPANATSATLTGTYLTTNTYFFRVWVKTNAKASDYSNVVSQQLAFPAPRNLRITSMTTSQVSLSWIDSSSFETGFEIEQAISSSNYSLVKTVSANTTSTTIASTFDSLSTYYFRVRAKSNLNFSAYSERAVVRMLLVGTVALWHFDESSGTTFSDASGNGNTGTANGTTPVAGQSGNARSFNGSSDYIQVPNSTNLNITGSEITLEAWVYLSARKQGKIIGIISKGGNEYARGYEILIDDVNKSSPQLQFVITTNRTTVPRTRTLNSATGLQLNRWYRIAGSYNGTVQKIFIDGSLDTSSTYQGVEAISGGSDQVYIGRRNPGNTEADYFIGRIDEVQISNIARW